MTKKDYHQTLELLHKRKVLDEKLQKTYVSEQSGHIGERFFAQYLTDELKIEPIIVFDFRFIVNGSECQIDCLLIFQNECVLIEVKNYSGQYLFNTGNMYFYPSEKKLLKQPLVQITRAKDMLRELFKELDIRMNISERVVFTNPNFYMFNVGPNEPFTFYGNLKNFIYELNQKPVSLRDYHSRILEKLNAVRLMSSSYSHKIKYEYETFSKGIPCMKCKGWMKTIGIHGRKNIKCDRCDRVEQIEHAVFRVIKEFNFLFPERKITVSLITDWIDGVVSEYKIREVLLKRCVPKGKNRHRHYLIKTNE